MKKYLVSSVMVLAGILFFSVSSFCQEQTPKTETTAVIASPKTIQKSDVKIAKGKMVSIEYLLKVDDKVVDSNVGKAPLTYIQGNSQIIPGLEKQLEGLKAGDAQKVEVPAKDGYGEYNPANTRELKVGAELVLLDTTGRMVPVVVKEIKKDAVVVDLNHPLAGKTLHFDIKILDVKDAPETMQSLKR